MMHLRRSTEILSGGTYRLNLDDYDALLQIFRSGARIVRVEAEGVLLSEPFDLATLDKTFVRRLEFERHEPFLRLRIGLDSPGTSTNQQNLNELVGESDSSF